MHIALVLAQSPAYSETFFNSKIKGLQAQGYTVTLYVGQTRANFDLCDVVVAPKVYKRFFKQFLASVIVYFSLLFHLKAVWKFIQLERGVKSTCSQVFKRLYLNSHLLKAHADWVHFGFATLALQREHVAKAIGAKLAVSFRGFDIDVYPLKHNNCYHKLWRSVDHVHTISTALLEKSYALGLPKTIPVTKIAPAIALEVFPFKVKKASKDTLVILTVARLHWMKGLIDTLEALAIIKSQGVKFTYRIVGDGPEREPLLFAIHQLGLDAEVEVVAAVSPEIVADYMRRADLYLQYSFSEGFCNAVLEAQASGCLCIVSDGGGLPENVIDNVTGWVVPKRQPKLLAACIEQVINLDAESQYAIRLAARERVETTFNLEAQQQAFVEFYNIN